MDELLKDFLAESSEQLEAIDAQLARFEREPSDARIVADIFRLVHVIKSACGFLNLQRLEKVACAAEALVVRLRDVAAPDAETVSLVLTTVDRIKFILAAVAQGSGEPPGDDEKLIGRIEEIAERAPELRKPTLSLASSLGENAFGSGPAPIERRADSVRVPVEALHNLTTLIGELTLTRDRLVDLAEGANAEGMSRPLRRLAEITADLRTGVRAVRMLPVERLFAGLHRLVRELTAESERPIELRLRGGQLQLDRELVEALRDPLTRIVRNAVEHGLETPSERRRIGKPDVGVIEVAARWEAGTVVIEVADDGRGTEGAALGEADPSRRLVAPDSGSARGLAAVSDGGAEFGIVRARLDPIGGSLALATRPGLGTTVTLRAPLAHPKSFPAFVLGAGDERFALPQACVCDIIDLDDEGGAPIDAGGPPALTFGKEVVPAARLHSLVGSPERSRDRGSKRPVALKIRTGRQTFALIVDEILDLLEIWLQPLPTPLRGLPMFSGAFVLGDESVVLALDPSGLADALGLPASDPSALSPMREAGIRISSKPLVVFRAGGGAAKALPVSVVTKILRLCSDQVELAEGCCVISIDGETIPLLDMEGPCRSVPTALRSTALLLRHGGDSLGLLVDEVADVVEAERCAEDPRSRRAVPGLARLAGAPIDILDPGVLFDGRKTRRRSAITKAEGVGVLILEPAEGFRRLIAATLDRAGFPTRAAADLETALADLPAAVALVDLDFAITLGGEIERRFDRPPTLIGTAGHGGPAMRARARTAGLTTAVGKFDRVGLIAAVRSALLERELAA